MPRRPTVRLAQPGPRIPASRKRDAAPPPPPDMPPARAERHDAITPARKRRFIEALAATGSVSEAARQAGVSRQSFYALRADGTDEVLAMAWDRAPAAATDILANVAYERAIDGVEEPVFWRGELVGTRRRYNDRLLMQLLRVRNPSEFAPLSDQRGWYTEIVPGAAPGLAELLDEIAPPDRSPADPPPAGPPPSHRSVPATKRAD
ncbi:hypothetical protein [Sphingomonas oryzagri]